jgi:alpha-tubulin suppressor-like RCC1 family protein
MKVSSKSLGFLLTVVFLFALFALVSSSHVSGSRAKVKPRIAAGGFHTVALKSDGTIWAWGDNGFGQLGDGGISTNRDTPAQIGTDTDWVSIAAGLNHTIALKSDGTLWAWGDNGFGQLGDGGISTNRDTPTQIETDTDWVSIEAVSQHTMALKSDGTLWAWGFNVFGQLGDNTTDVRYSPFQVHGENDIGYLTNVVAVSAGLNHTLALKSDGSLWAWGFNGAGQLGDNTFISSFTPVPIGGDTDWVSIAAGERHSIALKSDGTLWAWGSNIFGQLGDNTIPLSLTPVQIGGDTDWVSIAAGDNHTIALKSDGTLWAWGYNVAGQLGDSTTLARFSPVQHSA